MKWCNNPSAAMNLWAQKITRRTAKNGVEFFCARKVKIVWFMENEVKMVRPGDKIDLPKPQNGLPQYFAYSSDNAYVEFQITGSNLMMLANMRPIGKEEMRNAILRAVNTYFDGGSGKCAAWRAWHQYGVCVASKNRDLCSCDGDLTKCERKISLED